MSLAITGKIRLLTTPKTGVSGSGSPWANALAYCPNWIKTDDGWSENGGFTCSLGAFNDAAGQLAACSRGDVVEVVGKAKNVAIWAPEGREPRAQLDVKVETVTPVRTGSNRGDKPTDARSGATRDSDGPGKVPVGATQNRNDVDWPRPANPADARKVAGQRGTQTVRTPAPASSPVQVSVGISPTQDHHSTVATNATVVGQCPTTGQPSADVLEFRRGAMGRLARQHRNNRLTGSSA